MSPGSLVIPTAHHYKDFGLLVEDVLWGYDVNLTATHMAASTLGMLSPATRFQRMNVHRTLLGVFDGFPYLGSINFLTGQAMLAGWPSLIQQVASGEAAPPPPPQDLVIMNPPFTRDSLRHDQFSQRDELAIKEREKEVLAGQPHQAAARLSGSANAFMVLGDKILKPDAGTLAMILPTVMATNPAAFHTRRYLAHRFHIDTIVSSHDPDRIFFSENTSIGEILLICRRWNGDEPKPPTRVINLARNPATPLDALDTAARIGQASEEEVNLHRNFTVQLVDAERIRNGDWSAVNFLSPFLVEAYRELVEDDLGSIPMVPMHQVADVGPAGQRIRDAYTQSDLPTKSGRRALWHHKTNVTQSMAGAADTYIEPKAGKEHLAEKYWAQRSRMLLPTRLRLNLARVAAVMLPEQVVGSLWTPCHPHNSEFAKALCLYMNSTPGLLTLLGGRDNKIPAYPAFSLDTLRSLPVPDFRSMNLELLGLLGQTFDRLQDETLQGFPQMAVDPARHQIDDVVAQVLGLDPEWVDTVRRELAKEPSVTDARVPN